MGYERNPRRYDYDRGYRGGDYRNAGYRDQRDPRYDDPNDRGFFDRAGDEIRSWFGDEEAERRRRMDERYDEMAERDSYYGRERGRYADESVGGYRSPDRYPSWRRSNGDDRYRFSSGYAPSTYRYAATGEDSQFRTGYVDSARRGSYADARNLAGNSDDWRDREYREMYGRGGSVHDQGYSNWRNRQMSEFDRDYDEYRREHQSRFENEFSNWRRNRQTQRDSLTRAQEHMEVLGSDGEHVGKVDHVRGDRILLAKNDRDAGGHHHSIPSSWIQTVDDKVHLSRTAEEAKQAWRDEENNRGLFGDRDTVGDHGTANLNRSFSGTY